jgi:hypothetical protein
MTQSALIIQRKEGVQLAQKQGSLADMEEGCGAKAELKPPPRTKALPCQAPEASTLGLPGKPQPSTGC